MKPKQKGALLLAWHEGKVIQRRKRGSGDWEVTVYPAWSPHEIYRVKPEPKVETITIHGNPKGGFYLRADTQGDTHRITFKTIDGVPDCASVKMVVI